MGARNEAGDILRVPAGWRQWVRRDGDNPGVGRAGGLGGVRGPTPLSITGSAGLFFLLLFLGQDGLQHVAAGNMR